MIEQAARGMLAASAILLTACASAQSLAVQPRLSGGMQHYELRFEDRVLPLPNGGHDFRDGFEVTDQLSFVSGGLTFTKGRFFTDLSGQWSRNGRDRTDQVQSVAIGENVYTGGDGHLHRSDTQFKREEFNLTFGWGFTSNFSLYAGYKHAKTDLTQTLTPFTSPAPFVPPTGADGDVLFIGDYAMKFKYDGAFVGATSSVAVGDIGAFSLQAALARLDGEFSQTFLGDVFVTRLGFPDSRRPIDASFKDGTLNGKSIGVNIGISWTSNFAWLNEGLGNLSYTLGVDHSQYKFDAGKSTAIWAADLEEKNLRTRLDLRYRFGGG